MTEKTVAVEVRDSIAVVTLNRPESANTLNMQMGRDLAAAAIECEANPAVRAVVLTGAGKNFCFGGDLRGMITGGAGGVLRDILCNDVPLLFRSELYASVSVVTGLFYATAFGLKLNDELWTALTFALGLTLRLLAIRYKWEMPKFVFSGDR